MQKVERPTFLDSLSEDALIQLSKFLEHNSDDFVTAYEGTYSPTARVIGYSLFKLLKNGPRYS
jgi:hypothetical protein